MAFFLILKENQEINTQGTTNVVGSAVVPEKYVCPQEVKNILSLKSR